MGMRRCTDRIMPVEYDRAEQKLAEEEEDDGADSDAWGWFVDPSEVYV